MATQTISRRRPATPAEPLATPRVLPVSRPGRCAAASGAGVFDQSEWTDPFLSLDVFRRHGAVIPPHPHAGCAVVTCLFPESDTALHCRHAHEGDVLAQPGDLYWLETNCGTVHAETPVDVDGTVRGVRLVVNRAGQHAHGAPQTQHIAAADMPAWREGAIDMTLACGEWEGRHVGGLPAPAVTLLRLDWQDDEVRTLQLPDDARRWVALIVQGEAALAGHALRTDAGGGEALLLGAGEWQLAGRRGTRLVLAGGTPLDLPVVYRGNFAARDESDLVNLVRRYQQGSMGTL